MFQAAGEPWAEGSRGGFRMGGSKCTWLVAAVSLKTGVSQPADMLGAGMRKDGVTSFPQHWGPQPCRLPSGKETRPESSLQVHREVRHLWAFMPRELPAQIGAVGCAGTGQAGLDSCFCPANPFFFFFFLVGLSCQRAVVSALATVRLSDGRQWVHLALTGLSEWRPSEGDPSCVMARGGAASMTSESALL